MSDVITPETALELMEEEGYVYVDVRTEAEFEGGHPAGAYNIPVRLRGAAGLEPNEAFVDVVRASFASDAKLIVGCQMGGRSQAAAGLLRAAGFTSVCDQGAGWGGKKDPFGGTAELGWQACGLPIGLRAEAGRDYAALRDKAGR
jgi:rhodanese-related sulfurtransferase